MLYRNNKFIILLRTIGRSLMPSYERTYSIETEEAVCFDSISNEARMNGAAILFQDKHSLIFRVNNPTQGLSKLQWQAGNLLVHIKNRPKKIYEVKVTFSQLKWVLSILFFGIIFAGVVLKIPENPVNALVNFILIMVVWHIVTLSIIVSRWKIVINFIHRYLRSE